MTVRLAERTPSGGVARALPKSRPVLFMVVERFTPEDGPEIYRRVRSGGRMLPEGLRYVDSWVWANLRGCFQLMECDDPVLFQEWIAGWGNLAEFEIVPVAPSRVTADLMARLDAET